MQKIDIDKEEIIDIIDIDKRRVKNIYLYGSRVYGNYSISSDYDILVTACSMIANKEIYEDKYNIHITTPDIFEDRLRKHDIHCLECIYAPIDAKIQIKKDYLIDFEINPCKLKKMLFSQSTAAWHKARRKIEEE